MFGWLFFSLLLAALALAQVLGRAVWHASPRLLLSRLMERRPRLAASATFTLAAALAAAWRKWPLPAHIAGLALSVLGGLAVFWALRRFGFRKVESILLPPVSPRAFAVGIALAGLAVLAAISIILYQCQPFVFDSGMQLAHAQIFAGGHMKATPPPEALLPFFENHCAVVRNGVWRSQYFPGQPLVLALGLLAGIPWLTGPLLGAGALFLTYSIGRSLYDEPTGRLAALFLLSSPFFLIMQSEMMSHGTALFFCLAGFRLLCCPLGRRASRGLAFLGGLSVGMALATRPLSALPLAAIAGALPPRVWSDDQRRGSRRWLWAALGVAGPVAFLFYDNFAASGSPWITGYHLTLTNLHQLGFTNSFTPWDGIVNSLDNLALWNDWFLGWPVSSFLTAAALFALGRARRADWLLLAMAALLLVLYAFYSFHDQWFGPRFIYEAEGWMALLAARGCAEIFRRMKQWLSAPAARKRLRVICALGLASLMVGGPVRAWELQRLHNYGPLVAKRNEVLLDPLEPYFNKSNAIVFVSADYPEFLFLHNIRNFPNGPLFPRDIGEGNRVLMEAFPDRTFYRLQGTAVVPLAAPSS